MYREIILGLDNWSITEALLTWNGENNRESVGYQMKKKLLKYLRQLVGVCYCGIFLPGNNIRPESKINNNINSNHNNKKNKNSDNNK